MEIFCFLSGIIFFYSRNLLSLFFLVSAFLCRFKKSYFISFIFALGLGYIHQLIISDTNMPIYPGVKNAIIFGEIISIPLASASKTTFQFRIYSINQQKVKTTALMTCYENCSDISLNQVWILNANLQKPHNLVNPGGFNYLQWLNSKHLYWVGVVKKFIKTKKKNPEHFTLLKFRNNLALKLEELNLESDVIGIVQALSLGISSKINKDDWNLFRRTGTTHLMVISGAHIGFVSGSIFFFIRFIWCRIGVICRRIPAQSAASIGAIFAALLYSILAGFSFSVQRSFIACILVLSRNFLSVQFSAWQAWRLGIFIVLMIEPHAALFPGFYLSFLAVAILVCMNKYILVNGIKKAILIQLSCLIGLLPFTIFWFGYGAVNGFFANLLAIPLVGFIIVPLSILFVIASQITEFNWILYILKFSIHILWKFLHFIDSFSFINLEINFSSFLQLISLCISGLMLLFLPLKVLRLPQLVLLLIGFLPKQDYVKFGTAKVDVIDVGQGLSILIRTKNHSLVFDTGMKFYKGSDMAQLVINPYLNKLGMKKIDKVVISHPDLDHRGGLDSLEKKFKISELIVDNPSVYKRGFSCHHYNDWEWDGIKFHFFKTNNLKFSKNNSSCVLKVASKNTSVLLTGDIELLGEKYLVAKYHGNLLSDFLIVPHHGSKTSSSKEFLDEVRPKFAILSYGLNNKYNFPHEKALVNYKNNSIATYSTAECGMIRIFLG
ncbi:MAG: DNA internalization-related competence protein ComEC/Rec2 [Legionellales bacterium RIFCSPHIGHO2_12_FULL_35_11]|nr:MAG: DNA internalization-related competence protein ComEC/Rec2 [Legionellales bacterium RIFCSPHIGHO2_12_FULL_35_11]